MEKKKFKKLSIRILFVDTEDILTKSVGWKGEDWDSILDGYSTFMGGNLDENGK